MKIISATDAKTHFGKYLSVALTEPVTVKKTGRESIVMLSKDEYDRLEACEDAYWVVRTKMAEQTGYVGEEKGQEIMEKLLNAKA
jgi:prevent-host-death family protein